VPNSVLFLSDIEPSSLIRLLQRYQLQLMIVTDEAIPGSFWGDSEAGLIENRVYARADTPIHSILHESCHYICMDANRRASLHTNAEGDYDEENAVCYLQILLANEIPEMGQQRMFQDMDNWGYSFRLGSASDWFEQDAIDAKQWLAQHQLATDNRPSFQLRQ
jgi:hypothetical protein